MLPLHTRPLALLTVHLEPARMLGDTPAGTRKIVMVAGGSVEGERFSGRVLPGGGDWALTRADNVLLLDVRLTIEAPDGALIYCRYEGMRHGTSEDLAALARGDPVPPERLYFRIQPRFETASPQWAWLNRILCVGVGERLKAGPRYHIHEVA